LLWCLAIVKQCDIGFILAAEAPGNEKDEESSNGQNDGKPDRRRDLERALHSMKAIVTPATDFIFFHAHGPICARAVRRAVELLVVNILPAAGSVLGAARRVARDGRVAKRGHACNLFVATSGRSVTTHRGRRKYVCSRSYRQGGNNTRHRKTALTTAPTPRIHPPVNNCENTRIVKCSARWCSTRVQAFLFCWRGSCIFFFELSFTLTAAPRSEPPALRVASLARHGMSRGMYTRTYPSPRNKIIQNDRARCRPAVAPGWRTIVGRGRSP
jgi:hypothetical protein